jgi:hypothetical protein
MLMINYVNLYKLGHARGKEAGGGKGGGGSKNCGEY